MAPQGPKPEPGHVGMVGPRGTLEEGSGGGLELMFTLTMMFVQPG